MYLSSALVVSLLAQSIYAQSSTYVEPTVPTGTPVAGNYAGDYRPQIHFSPPRHFMNDPNGMFKDANGTWHLYYQYNPTGIVAGNQHWGHATTTDLYHWVNQPIALFPPSPTQYVFSGSAVTDPNNTSGFFPDQDNGVVAVYTLATYNPNPGPQTQNIAYSFDGGYSFIPYAGNPVIDSTSSQFRDPKVFWYQDHWVLIVAYAVEFTIGIYTSADLKSWTHASNFTHHGLLGLQFECPNLVEMPVEGTGETKWVLYISINPGAPLGGSIGQYFPGDFNGTHFEPIDSVSRIADFSKDNYAGQFFNGVPHGEDAVSIAWASNWQYTQEVPTGPLEDWRSAMSLPRRNFLTNATRIGWVMASLPYDLTPVLDKPLAQNDSLGNSSISIDYSTLYSKALYISVNVTNIPSPLNVSISQYATLNMTFWSPLSHEKLRLGFYFGGDTPFFIDRGGIRGFQQPFFTDKFSTNTLLSGSWSFEGVIDRTILEVFLQGGRFSGTTTFYPDAPLTKMDLETGMLPPGTTVSVAVWGVKSAWKDYEDEEGVVVGNVTSGGNGKRYLGYEAGL